MDDSSSKIGYRISKKALDLLPILEQMTAFSIKHEKEDVFGDRKFSSFKDAFGREPSTLKKQDSFSKNQNKVKHKLTYIFFTNILKINKLKK
ncbi:hypothetical protein [Nitrosopumilus sp.]|uniref:hypothetical protein n=1 Tax=Nitrosopumilus sp. TaxID=2024843 RepID=UPI00292FBF87|nr:hypothetical protein [Nitrosopumilus sp.]